MLRFGKKPSQYYKIITLKLNIYIYIYVYKVKVKVAQSCPTLYDFRELIPPGDENFSSRRCAGEGKAVSCSSTVRKPEK